MDFDTEVRLARYAATDYPRLIERIRMRKPDGWTAFYDALGVYLNGAAEQDGQKILRDLHRRRRHAQRADLQRVLDLLQGLGRHGLRRSATSSTSRSRRGPSSACSCSAWRR